jgi:hypothetical protein
MNDDGAFYQPLPISLLSSSVLLGIFGAEGETEELTTSLNRSGGIGIV